MRDILVIGALISAVFSTPLYAQSRDIGEELHQDGLKTITTQLSRDFKLGLDQSAPLGGLTTIKLDAGSDVNALVLINDMPIEPVLADQYDFAHIGIIERVNIMRGDQSALFGDNAKGGAIKIKTRKAPTAAKPIKTEPVKVAAFEPVAEITKPDPQPDPTKAEPVTVTQAEIFSLNTVQDPAPVEQPKQAVQKPMVKTVIEPVPVKKPVQTASTGTRDYGAIFDRLQEEKRRKAMPVDLTKLYSDLKTGSLETRQCEALATEIQKDDKTALGAAMNAALSNGFGTTGTRIANCQYRSDITSQLCDAPERDKTLLIDSDYLYLNYHFLKYAPTALCGSKSELAAQYIKLAAGNHAGAQYIYGNMLYSKSLNAKSDADAKQDLERESFILFHKSADQGNAQSATALKAFFDYEPANQSAE